MEYAKRKRAYITGKSWSSVAFIVESILLLVFLVGSLAILTQVFSASLTRSVESRTLDAATIAATSVAEHFSADPEGVQERTELGDLIVICNVDEEKRVDGTMYSARISVYDVSSANSGEPVYSVETTRYESGA